MSRPSNRAIDQAIQQCLQPEVITRIRGNIYHFGCLEVPSDSNLFHQSLYISTWRALQENPTLVQLSPKEIADIVYGKLTSQIRSKGRDQLGEGARRKSTLFNNYTIPLQQSYLEQIPDSPSSGVDELVYAHLLDELQQEIRKIYIKNPRLKSKIAQKRSIITEIRRSKQLQRLLVRAAQVLDSPRDGLSLLKFLLFESVN